MAVRTNIHGQEEISYVGKVLNWYEMNGYEDSDWYAEVWDEETQRIKSVEYMTTRCGCWGVAECDATDDILRKVYRQKKKSAASYYDQENEKKAKTVSRGDTVRIIKGRKVKVGTVAVCFWAGQRYNQYSRMVEDRIGVEVNGERVFINAENAIPVDWEARLVRGKERKNTIRRMANEWMPISYRSYFKTRRKLVEVA